MKVLIKGYLNWYGPYQIAEILCTPFSKWIHWLDDEQVHKFGTFLAGDKKDTILMKVCEWVHSKRKRAIKVKIHEYDAWNADSTLAIIILPLLKEVKKQKDGTPCCMPGYSESINMMGDQQCFDFMVETNEEVIDYASKKWDEIIDEMIWTFEQLQPDYDWETQYWIREPKLDLSKYPEDEGKICVPVRWSVEGDCDWVGMKKHQERINNGLKLFSEYYQTLWS